MKDNIASTLILAYKLILKSNFDSELTNMYFVVNKLHVGYSCVVFELNSVDNCYPFADYKYM